ARGDQGASAGSGLAAQADQRDQHRGGRLLHRRRHVEPEGLREGGPGHQACAAGGPQQREPQGDAALELRGPDGGPELLRSAHQGGEAHLQARQLDLRARPTTMVYAITQTCCNDASCVAVCPVNCIHPTPDEPEFGTTDMLYIDPRSCIDCGACADACPVDAIFPVDRLSESLKPYAEVNARFYEERPVSGDVLGSSPNFHNWGPPTFDRTISSDFPALDVAVVGSGPAGMYAVEDLLLHTSARVTLIDRLDVAGGLIRFGVAPDHPSTKRIDETFARYREHPRLTLRLGVEVGRDVTVEELAARHDAVIYAVGASSARSLGIAGEWLPGSLAATDVVAWYNGHPDATLRPELSAQRAVLVGAGNVALDVARILSSEPSGLESTSISREALARLRSSS